MTTLLNFSFLICLTVGCLILCLGVAEHCKAGGKWADLTDTYSPKARRTYMIGWAIFMAAIVLGVFLLTFW